METLNHNSVNGLPVVVKKNPKSRPAVVRKSPPRKAAAIKATPRAKQEPITPIRTINPNQTVERQKKTYWQEQGWKVSFWKSLLCFRKVYVGRFRTHYASFDGQIVGNTYYIFNPSPEILQGPHKPCFTPTMDGLVIGKYKIHFNPYPADINAGIASVERTIRESYAT